jgi:hypothetical protein
VDKMVQRFKYYSVYPETVKEKALASMLENAQKEIRELKARLLILGPPTFRN